MLKVNYIRKRLLFTYVVCLSKINMLFSKYTFNKHLLN